MSKTFKYSGNSIQDLIYLMERLRDPDNGCPWDLEQDFATIAPYTIEESYEVADAIEHGTTDDLIEELGDLFLQVVFQSQIGKDKGLFDINEVARRITEKMVRRHPHVFGDQSVGTADAQTENWENIKEKERALKSGKKADVESALDGVAIALPALIRSGKLMKRAARTGFDWPDIKDAFDKVEEELREIKDAHETGDTNAIKEEVGDLLIAAANLSRKLEIDPEEALRASNFKFEKRFRTMELLATNKGKTLKDFDVQGMLNLWADAKKS